MGSRRGVFKLGGRGRGPSQGPQATCGPNMACSSEAKALGSSSSSAPAEVVAMIASILRQAASAIILLVTLAVARVRRRGSRLGGRGASIRVDLRIEYRAASEAFEGEEGPVQASMSTTAKVLVGPSSCGILPQPPVAFEGGSLAFPATPTAGITLRPPSTREGRHAYVTLLTRDSYLPGAQCLARSLRAAAAQHPLLVMYTPDTLSPNAVAAMQQEGNCLLVAVERYVPPGKQDYGKYKLSCYAECWTKLRMWEMDDEYDRLVYLDADMVLLGNIDALFELKAGFYAAGDCAFGRPSQEERDACALFCHKRPNYFNAGFFVMSPSRAEFRRFDNLLASGAIQCGGYAEQDLLNEYFKGSWGVLPYTFNAQKVIKLHHPQLWRLEEICVLHFVDHKPWHRDDPAHAPYEDLLDLWWRIFEGRYTPCTPASCPTPA